MIQWLCCFILGHKRVHKVTAGPIRTPVKFGNFPTGQYVDVPTFKYANSSFCLRCGKEFKDATPK